MRGYSGWSYRPYVAPEHFGRESMPYICRMAPTDTGFTVQWFDAGTLPENRERFDAGTLPEEAENSGCESEYSHRLLYRLYRTDDEPETVDLRCEASAMAADRALCGGGSEVTVEGLLTGRDYEVWIERRDNSAKSAVRLVRCVKAPGVTVNYLHPKDRIYSFSGQHLCSPSLVKLRENTYLTSMDVYAAGAPQNLSLLFRTEDGGNTWRYVCELFPCFWGKLFVHHDVLYVLAATTEYGNLVIGCSHDEGYTWSAPVTLLTGAGKNNQRGVHKAPMPVVEHEGRLYTAVEYGSWMTGGHGMGVLSIDADTDLMTAENWQCTGFLPYDPTWPGAEKNSPRGSVEGNVVVSPDGEVRNILRYNTSNTPANGKALVLAVDAEHPEAPLRFKRFIDSNGANSKFELQKDPVTGTYWAIVNEVLYRNAPTARNVLSLAFSRDLEQFTVVRRLIDCREQDMDVVGFQYPSFIIDGDDICFLSRTAFGGAANFHDTNQITFHRITNFRQYMIPVQST